MAIHRYFVLICVVAGAVALPKPNRDVSYPFTFVSREEWGARPSGTAVSPLDTPVPYVVIHHSYIPSDCSSRDSCVENMHYMQDLHQITNGWQDIGYNFAVGGDGAVYEGRGWETVGAHAVGYNSKSIGIVLIGDFVLVQATSSVDNVNTDKNLETRQPFPLHPRESWAAAPPSDAHPLTTPVPYVVIHHTYLPAACNTTEECAAAMRSMQKYHNSLEWGDIGYNFCVGSEGGAYEGRGWDTRGIHARQANNYSIGICLIGDWRVELPPHQQLETTKALIAAGIQLGKIYPDYKLVGHQQVSATECGALYREIATWDHYTPGTPDFTNYKSPTLLANLK